MQTLESASDEFVIWLHLSYESIKNIVIVGSLVKPITVVVYMYLYIYIIPQKCTFHFLRFIFLLFIAISNRQFWLRSWNAGNL